MHAAKQRLQNRKHLLHGAYMSEETNNIITIDDKEYNYEELTNEAKYCIAQLRDLKSQIEAAKAKLDQLNVAHNGFGSMLASELSKPKETEGA